VFVLEPAAAGVLDAGVVLLEEELPQPASATAETRIGSNLRKARKDGTDGPWIIRPPPACPSPPF
jgi:hypothetical protein